MATTIKRFLIHDLAFQRDRRLTDADRNRVRSGAPVVKRTPEGLVRFEMAAPYSEGYGGAYPWNDYYMIEGAK